LHEARSRRREAGGAELLTPRRRDLVRRPRVVVHDLDLRLGAEAGHRVLERALHELERRAAEKRRRELHVDVSLLDVDRSDDAEVDERDDWDLRVGDPLERLPDLLRRHHCAPTGAERRTIVISSCRAANESSKTPRSTASTSSSPTRAESAARCSGRTTPSAYGHSSDTASRKRGSSCSRSCHISACIRWYASSRSILAATGSSSRSAVMRISSATSYSQRRAIVCAQSSRCSCTSGAQRYSPGGRSNASASASSESSS